jgi:FkbH-like protein
MVSDSHHTITVTLADKYGDYGMISTVILEKMADDTIFIDTWIMSCRVLKRGVEWIVLDEIISVARNNGFRYIEGEYLRTPKNGLVTNHYPGLGFDSLTGNERYRLTVSDYTGKKTFITKTSSYANHE